MNHDTQNPEETKKSQLDIAQLVVLLKPATIFFKRHLVLMFIVLTLSALIYAVIMVNTILQQGLSNTESTNGKYDSRFDETTITKINVLNNRDQTPSITLPGGRINPFSE